MGFDEGRIILDSDNGAYYAGQTVYGRIVFDQAKQKTIHGIYVSFKGYCKVRWTTTRSRRRGDRRVRETVVHESYEEYFHRKTFLLGSESGDHILNAGHYDFKFDFPLPVNCPSSFESDCGHIRYRVKLVMVTSGIFSSNKEKKAAIRLHTPLDLNLNPHCRTPVEFDLTKTYCCWCVSAGSSEIHVKMPVGGYCPGQVIPLEVSVTNLSSVKIKEIRFAIKRNIQFEAVSHPATKNDHSTIAEITKGPIPASTTRNWNLTMEVPAMDIYNLNGCRYIRIDYYFKVSTKVGGCHTGAEESHPIIFGTVPLVGFQDNVQNPLQDQLPKPIQVQNVQANNPYSPPLHPQSYPSNTPYPAPNVSPYPNQPFPNVAPYPNPPYPNTGSPYHPTHAGYPGQSTAPPYPVGTPAPPYPGSNTTPFYPGGNISPPYLNDDPAPPYPGGNPKMPLLSSDAPYPTSPPMNPFATASAPSGPSEISSHHPAYNPDFTANEKSEKPH